MIVQRQQQSSPGLPSEEEDFDTPEDWKAERPIRMAEKVNTLRGRLDREVSSKVQEAIIAEAAKDRGNRLC